MIAKLPRSLNVLSHESQGKTGRVLRLAGAAPFTPGQVVGLSLPPSGPQRWYSLSSAPGQPWYEVIYSLVEDGALTPELWRVEPGDQVWLQGPRGSFFDPAVRPSGLAVPDGRVFWICNGTGVSPFLSLIRHALDSGASWLAERLLVFGCRTLDDAYGLADIRSACERAGLRAVICLSAPGAQDAAAGLRPAPDELVEPGLYHFPGRLTSWPGLAAPGAGDRAMLCGASPMVAELRERLERQGLDLADIFAEIYF